MKQILILFIVTGGFFSQAAAQQLASEKPMGDYYSKITKQKLSSTANTRQPAATRSRQQLSSEKDVPQPAVPSSVKITAPKQKRVKTTGQKTASEKPLDMEKINRQRRRSL